VAIYPLTARPEDVLAANTYDSIRNLLFGDVTILGRYNHVAWHLFEQFHAAPDLAPDDMATIAAAHPDLLCIEELRRTWQRILLNSIM
jgi:6-phospho-beta-glucosidase